MNVHFVGSSLGFLKRRLRLEGDVETTASLAELVLSDSVGSGGVGGDMELPRPVLVDLGYDLAPDGVPAAWLATRWFGRQGWNPQLIVGIPLRTLMNDDLGPPCEAGLATRFVESVHLAELFDAPALRSMLERVAYAGLVSIEFSDDGRVVHTRTGCGYNGLLNALEGARGRTSVVLRDGTPLRESWAVGLRVTRSPYPHAAADGRIEIGGVTPATEKHLWLDDDTVETFRSSTFTRSTTVGVVTAWGTSLAEASRRVLRTARGLDVPSLQYRTDVLPTASAAWHRLGELGIVSSD